MVEANDTGSAAASTGETTNVYADSDAKETFTIEQA